MLPEEKARIKIDKQLKSAGWDIVSRNEYVPQNAQAVKEALMNGNTESDYLLFVDGKAIAVVEAKKKENNLGAEVAAQAESYSVNPQGWYQLWFPGQIPLVYLANGNKIYFKNMLTDPDGDYVELTKMHSPKKMLQLIGKKSEYGALPRIEKNGLRDCQYNAEVKLEQSLKAGKEKALAVLATGSGKTYLACLAAYRLLNYTPTKRVLFLVDRNNLARQTETEFSLFDRTENSEPMNKLYQIKAVKVQQKNFLENVISNADYKFLKNQLKKDGNLEWYFVVWFLAATGARVSELIQIKIEHVELGYFDLYSKGGKLRRLYIPKKLRDETAKWLAEENRSSGYLFLNRYGEKITVRGISQQLKNYAEKYGLDKKVVYPHSFRHRYAKNFLEKFNDIALLADLMGHESIETTRIYLRRTASEQQALVDKIVTW